MEEKITSPSITTNRNIWFISDTHWGHANILKFKIENDEPLRVFDSVEHMNQTMEENWNAVVRPDDIVYHLGDVYFGEGHQVLPRLKGRKRLVLGNHDMAKSHHIQNNFQKIMAWRMFPEFGIVCTHIPLHPGSFEMKSLINVHGHTHKHWVQTTNEQNETVNDTRYFNASVENHNFTPIHLEDLLLHIRI